MQRELGKDSISQDLTLKSRKKLCITGVKKVNSLNEEEFLVITSLGLLQITGNNLEMVQLEMEKGTLEISGDVNKLEYLKEPKKEKKFFRNVFKWFTH